MLAVMMRIPYKSQINNVPFVAILGTNATLELQISSNITSRMYSCCNKLKKDLKFYSSFRVCVMTSVCRYAMILKAHYRFSMEH